jgi:hypothetical protein
MGPMAEMTGAQRWQLGAHGGVQCPGDAVVGSLVCAGIGKDLRPGNSPSRESCRPVERGRPADVLPPFLVG